MLFSCRPFPGAQAFAAPCALSVSAPRSREAIAPRFAFPDDWWSWASLMCLMIIYISFFFFWNCLLELFAHVSPDLVTLSLLIVLICWYSQHNNLLLLFSHSVSWLFIDRFLCCTKDWVWYSPTCLALWSVLPGPTEMCWVFPLVFFQQLSKYKS